jgi:hypothetical protein
VVSADTPLASLLFPHSRGEKVRFDSVGQSCEGLFCARSEAIRTAKVIIRDSNQPCLHRWVVIADEFGKVVLRVSFDEAARE